MENSQLREFMDALITDKGLVIASDDVRTQLIEDMMQRALDLIDREVIASMSSENVTKLNQMLDSGSPDEDVRTFIAASVPDMAQVTARTLQRFRAAYLNGPNK